MRLRRGPSGKYLLVVNPMSRMGKGLRIALWIIARFVVRRIDFDAVVTRKPGHAERIVAEYEGNIDVVVAIGSDGTIQEIINGIMKREKKPALAVVPAGRGNDFCTLVGIGRSKRKALKYMLSDDTSEVDLLRFNGRYAGNVVGIGLDALVQEKSSRFRHWPVIRYLVNTVLLILKGLEPIPMKIRYADGTLDGSYVIAVVGHTRKYARQIRLFPGLRIDGGVMKLAVARPAGRLVTMIVLFSAGMAFASIYPQVTIVESHWFEIEVGKTAKAQSDGDLFYLGKDEKLRVELVRRAIEVKTPFGSSSA